MPARRKYPKLPRKINSSYRPLQARPSNTAPTTGVQEKHDAVNGDEGGLSERGANGSLIMLPPEGPRLSDPGESSTSPLNLSFARELRMTLLEESNSSAIAADDVAVVPRTAPGPGIFPVAIETESGSQPLQAFFDKQQDHSCIPEWIAEKLVKPKIRFTTPAQRQRWYFTPAGPIYYAERYVELNLKAFDPHIPSTKLFMLLWKGQGPREGIHVYLGRQVLMKLAQQDQPQRFGMLAGFHPNLGTNFEISNTQDNIIAAGDGGPDTSAHFHPDLAPIIIGTEQMFTDCNSQGTISTMTHPSSLVSSYPSTVSTFDAPPIPAFMKNPNEDIVWGTPERATGIIEDDNWNEDGQGSEGINVASMSTNISQPDAGMWISSIGDIL